MGWHRILGFKISVDIPLETLHKSNLTSESIHSHELTYISATNCFMHLGQSSGN